MIILRYIIFEWGLKKNIKSDKGQSVMGNWYNIIKEANSLANSLSISPYSNLYKDIQKYEKNLKSDGHWQKILDIKRQRNKLAAERMLEEIIEGYKAERVNDSLLEGGDIEHVKSTPTGGEWYLLEGNEDFKNIDNEEDVPLSKLFVQKVKSLQELACGGGWCISQEGRHQATYLKQGYSFLVLRRHKKPRLAIAFHKNGGFNNNEEFIGEVQGIGNELDKINSLDALDLMEVPLIDDISLIFEAIDNQEIQKLKEDGYHEDDISVDSLSIIEEKSLIIEDKDINTPEMQELYKEINHGKRNGLIYYAKKSLSEYGSYTIKNLTNKLHPFFDGNHNFGKSYIADPVTEIFRQSHSPIEIIDALVNFFGEGTWVFSVINKLDTLKELVKNLTLEDFLTYVKDISKAEIKNNHPEKYLGDSMVYLEKILPFSIPEQLKKNIIETSEREIYKRDFLTRSGLQDNYHELIRSKEEFDMIIRRYLSKVGLNHYGKNGLDLLNFYQNALQFLPEYATQQEFEELKRRITQLELNYIKNNIETPIVAGRMINNLIKTYVTYPDVAMAIKNDPAVQGYFNRITASCWYGKIK